LLCQPSERLGKNGLIDFQKHPFFKDFDWENIRRMTPPFVPKLSSETDCSYFEMPPDVDFTPTEVTDINEYSNLLKNAPPLKNFTYNNFELPVLEMTFFDQRRKGKSLSTYLQPIYLST